MKTNNNSISKTQLVFLTYFSFTGLSTYAFPKIYAIDGRGAWMVEIIGAFVLLPIALWLLYVCKKHPGKTALEIIEFSFGKAVSVIVNILFVLTSIVLSVCMVTFFINLLQVYFLIHTPIWLTAIVLVSLSAAVALSDLRIIGRLTVILGILLLLVFFSGMSLGLAQIKLSNIWPIFLNHPSRFLIGTYEHMGQMIEGILALMTMTSTFCEPIKYRPAIIKGVILFGLSFGLGGMINTAMQGIYMVSLAPFSALTIAQLIELKEFIYGIEIFILIPYTFLEYSKLTIYLYSSWVALKQIVNIQRPQLLLWIIAVIVATATIWINSYNTAFYFAVMISKYFMVPFVLLLLILTTIRSLKKKNE